MAIQISMLFCPSRIIHVLHHDYVTFMSISFINVYVYYVTSQEFLNVETYTHETTSCSVDCGIKRSCACLCLFMYMYTYL